MNRWDNPHFDTWLERLPDTAAIEVRSDPAIHEVLHEHKP
jgi:hypothetical protein